VGLIQRELHNRLGTNFAYLGDEIYLKAGMKIPGRRHYGNYPQIEDGIGMVRSFENLFDRTLTRLSRAPLSNPAKINGTIFTGTLFAPVLQKNVDELNERFGTRLHVEGVQNQYFGGDVSVAGLLSGGDMISAREKIRGHFLIVPKTVLKSDDEVMLDGTRLEELRTNLRLPIEPTDIDSFETLLRRLSA
jgi:NifB/MoaA-like Fe-S oxidoreductase